MLDGGGSFRDALLDAPEIDDRFDAALDQQVEGVVGDGAVVVDAAIVQPAAVEVRVVIGVARLLYTSDAADELTR